MEDDWAGIIAVLPYGKIRSESGVYRPILLRWVPRPYKTEPCKLELLTLWDPMYDSRKETGPVCPFRGLLRFAPSQQP